MSNQRGREKGCAQYTLVQYHIAVKTLLWGAIQDSAILIPHES
jgi:hypothetical protein